MKRPDKIKIGMTVRTTKLDSTDGLFVKQEILDRRQEGKVGTIVGLVSGHGGDAWFILHQDNSMAAYWFTEFKNEK